MSDKAFARAMYQIANEAEAQQAAEMRAQERRKRWGKIRKVCVFLFGAIALGCGFYFRQDLEQCASKLGEKLNSQPRVDGTTAAALKDIKQGAAKRDQALEEISK